MPKISVITPTYNRMLMLEETIKSVLKQNYTDFEYIIVDDGSTDATEDMVKKYLTDKRVKYYKHDNIGEPKTVNRGYDLSTGEYTIVVNSDDPLFDENYFTQAIKCFENNPEILAVYPDWIAIDENSNEIKKVYDRQYDFLELSKCSGLMIGPGMIIKRSALKKIGFRDENVKYTGDLTITFQIARMGKIQHLKIFGATHRIHAGCLQNTAPQEEIGKELLDLYLRIYKSKRKNIPREFLINKNKKAVLQTALHMFKAYSGGGGAKPASIKDLKEYNSLFNNIIDKIYLYYYFKNFNLIV